MASEIRLQVSVLTGLCTWIHILSELRDAHVPTTASSNAVHSLFIATIALRLVRPAKLGGNTLRPQPLMFNTGLSAGLRGHMRRETYRSAPSAPRQPPSLSR